MNSWITLAVALAGITQCMGADVEVVFDSSTTCVDYSKRNLECTFNSASSTYKLPNLPSINSYEAFVKVVELQQSSSYNLTQFCAEDLTVVKSVSSCLVNSYRQCADNDFKTLIPTAEQYSQAIDYACNKKDTIQSIEKCFDSSIGSITDCNLNNQARQSLTDGAKPSRSNEFSEFTKFHCGRRNINLECRKIDEDFKECSIQDYTSYEEFMSNIKPEGCNGVNGLMYTTSLLLVSIFSLLHRYL